MPRPKGSVPSDARREAAQQLRDTGLTYKQIGERLGVSGKTVQRWLNPDYAERSREQSREWKDRNREAKRAYDREYDRTHKATCPSCGGEMNRETGRLGGKCEACHADDVDRRARQIERWWAEGLLMREIAARLGWSVNRLNVEMHGLRAKGYSLPLRRQATRERRR